MRIALAQNVGHVLPSPWNTDEQLKAMPAGMKFHERILRNSTAPATTAGSLEKMRTAASAFHWMKATSTTIAMRQSVNVALKVSRTRGQSFAPKFWPTIG